LNSRHIIPHPFIQIGYIRRAFGNNGEIEILPAGRKTDRFKNLSSVTLVFNGSVMDEYIVDTVKIHSSRVILKLKSIDTRPSAESLVKADVCIHESQAVKRSEWEFFHHELIGLQVTTITGQHVGILKDVW